jgi:hypothetical protein
LAAGRLVAAIRLPLMLMAQGQAQTYPSKPIRVVVPFPPGGTNDATARVFAGRLSPALGQPMDVDNRAGATGAIGVMAVTNAVPDGHTLLVASDSSVILGPLLQVPSRSTRSRSSSDQHPGCRADGHGRPSLGESHYGGASSRAVQAPALADVLRCWRRSNIDPLRRSKFDPGRGAAS